jgi:hypothetical protein
LIANCPNPTTSSGKYRAYGLHDPAVPLAISSAVRSSFTGLRRSQLSDQCCLSSSSAFHQSVARTCPSRPAAAGQRLSWAFVPYSARGSGGPLSRGLPAPATFRPQGLVTLSAVYSLRARAGHFSCRRRSWDSPFGAFSFRKVSATFPGGSTHTPFLPSVSPAA